MRKLFCIILAFLFIFPNGWVYADDATATQEVEIIKFEAEDFISATYKANSILNNDASNGEFLQIYKNPDNNDIIFEYSVDVSKDGLYEIRGVTSVWGSHLTADFLISVNDSEFKAPRVTKLADVTNSAAPSIMTKNSLGVYNFVRGSNVIKVKVDQNDKRSDGLIISYLDSFEVLPGKEELNGGLMSIDTTPGIGVFEKQESVKLVLNFSGPIGSDISYRFIITDAWNNEVKTGVVTARKKQEKYTVNIGNFDLGWYKVKLYENDEQMTDTGLQTLFSVIQNTNKRKFYSDSPFATDFASRYHFNGTNKWQPNDVGAVAEYAEVMHDIGISWARNRTHDILPATPESVKTKTEDPHGDAILSNDVSILECCYGNGSEFVYDLRDVYNSHKYYAEIHKGKSKTLEINNEEDAHSSSPGDVFASFFKAAALGIADGDPNMKKEIGGLCMDTSNPFTRILYMNDFMKYSDYATGHAHKQSGTELTTINGNAILKDFINISNAYDSKKGLEMNEGGLGYVCDVGAYASDGAMLTQARYYIVQQTTYLSWESDRNYWFLFEYYPEFGVNYGSFSPYNEPYPVINSIATTTYNLGKGKFKGVLDNLPAGAQGYMFDDGENDVAVIWYNDQQDASGNWEVRTDKAVTVVDMMGKESVKKAIGNKALIPVSYWPTFVKFNGRTDKYNYYLTEKAERVTDVVEYDKNDRVLIQTLWDGQDLQEAKQNGYVLKLDEEQPIKVNVYNFNKEAVSGTIKVSSDNEDMVEIRNAEINYEVEPGGKSEYVVYAKLKDEKYSGLQAYMSFDGTSSDGGSLSKYITMVFGEVVPGRIISDYIVFDTYADASKHDLSNNGGGKLSTFSTGVENELGWKYDWSQGGQVWEYPIYTLPEPGMLEGTSGICFYIKASETIPEHKCNLFVYYDDGTGYYLGDKNFVQLTDEWQQIIIPWKRMICFGTPLGNLDTRGLVPSLISKISIGGNYYGNKHSVEFIVKDAAYYYSDDPRDVYVPEGIPSFPEIKPDMIYSTDEVENVEIKLPDNNYTEFKVELQRVPQTNYTIEGDTVKLNLGKLEKGYYTLQATMIDYKNYARTKVVNFYVE